MNPYYTLQPKQKKKEKDIYKGLTKLKEYEKQRNKWIHYLENVIKTNEKLLS